MLKYTKLEVDNYLIPSETCLVFTLADKDNKEGTPLFIKARLKGILEEYENKVSCVVFKGADFKPALIKYWADYIYKHFPKLKIGWVSQLDEVPSCIVLHKMDYIFLKDNLYRRDYNSNKKSFKNSWELWDLTFSFKSVAVK